MLEAFMEIVMARRRGVVNPPPPDFRVAGIVNEVGGIGTGLQRGEAGDDFENDTACDFATCSGLSPLIL